MKLKLPQIKITDILVFVFMWIIGIGIFSFLLNRLGVNWIDALLLSVVPSIIWTLIGFIGAKKDEKIVAGRKAITDAVAECFHDK